MHYLGFGIMHFKVILKCGCGLSCCHCFTNKNSLSLIQRNVYSLSCYQETGRGFRDIKKKKKKLESIPSEKSELRTQQPWRIKRFGSSCDSKAAAVISASSFEHVPVSIVTGKRLQTDLYADVSRQHDKLCRFVF